MSRKAEILARLSGEPRERPLFLPDLTLWYNTHQARGALPPAWQQHSLPEVARALGVPLWWPVRPWRVETPDVTVTQTEGEGERIVHYETAAGPLMARWVRGPDGDWWQSDYPVTDAAQLPAALALAQAHTYRLDPSAWSEAVAQVGEDGLVALEIPRRPYADVLHEFVGWGEGVMLLQDHRPALEEILAILEDRRQQLMAEIAELPGEVALSPDNLDGQYISPAAFQNDLAPSYRRTAETLHRKGKRLLVHVGGPIRRLFRHLAATGIDGVEGIAGAPQSDLTLSAARELAGPELTLWGGIPQDLLLPTHSLEELEAAVSQAVHAARGDARILVGVADRVPAEADLARLQALREMIAGA